MRHPPGIIAGVMPLNTGDRIPDFVATTDEGTTLSSSDLQGRTTVLYFYSKADTPG
jgi:thioredoxin-dependent peroxiredoxin